MGNVILTYKTVHSYRSVGARSLDRMNPYTYGYIGSVYDVPPKGLYRLPPLTVGLKTQLRFKY
jgi:hypothetical protein